VALVHTPAIQAADATVITAAEATKIPDWLRLHADAILREVGCDLAWNALSPDERDAEQKLTTSGELLQTYGQRVETSAASAIEDAGRREFLSVFGARVVNAVDWVKYGKDVQGKATKLFGTNETATAELQQPIYINGATYTRALVYYARACLKPPS
jgi:hypothetical protein